MLSAIKNFFNFSNWSVYIIIALVIIAGYYRIDALKNENAKLETEVENVVEENNKIAQQMVSFQNQVQDDLIEQKQFADEMREANKRNNQAISDLYDTFNTSADGSERDLEALTVAKPGLIERRINDATKKVFDNVEKNSNISSD